MDGCDKFNEWWNAPAQDVIKGWYSMGAAKNVYMDSWQNGNNENEYSQLLRITCSLPMEIQQIIRDAAINARKLENGELV